MPKVTKPLFGDDAQGQVGKKIIFRRGGVVLRYFKPGYRNTEAQAAHRAQFKELYMSWLTKAAADLLYAALDHLHDERYSTIDHSHIHGDLAALDADDHLQYLTPERANALYSLLAHLHDHGALTGLGDDDHAQYYNQTRGDARYSLGTHNHDALYSVLAHLHDANYAALGHNHNALYSALAHLHDANYAAIGHTHATLPAVDGYTLQGHGGALSPVDATRYLVGNDVVAPTTQGNSRVYVPKAGAIKKAWVVWHAEGGTAGSGETITFTLVKNNTLPRIDIGTVGNTSSLKTVSNTGMNTAVAEGDYLWLDVLCPTWVTNPTSVKISWMVFIDNG